MNYNTEVLKSKPCDYNDAYILEKNQIDYRKSSNTSSI